MNLMLQMFYSLLKCNMILILLTLKIKLSIKCKMNFTTHIKSTSVLVQMNCREVSPSMFYGMC